MSDNKWTPADLPGCIEWWTADQGFIVRNGRLTPKAGGGLSELPSGHPYKASPSDLDHLAPDHPWRKGTIPRPE